MSRSGNTAKRLTPRRPDAVFSGKSDMQTSYWTVRSRSAQLWHTPTAVKE